jgi:twitching motility protein PilT
MDAAPLSIDDLLARAVAAEASDLHLVPGAPPSVRVHGDLQPLPDAAKLVPDATRAILYRILSTEQQKQLEVNRQLDFSYGVPGLARFRVNVHFQRDSLAAAFRHIPEELRTLEELGLPPSLRELAMKPRGLVLVTGPTGSGKSTTLASMVDEVNRHKPHHILTVEDPIEFVHRHKRCIVTQREIGTDAPSFGEALRAALRQDPDVILLGEMRDLETIATLRVEHDRPRHRRLSSVAAGAGPHAASEHASGDHHPDAPADGRRPRPRCVPGGPLPR